MSRRGERVCDGCGEVAPEKGHSNTMPPLWGRLSRYVFEPDRRDDADDDTRNSFDLCPNCFVRVRDAVKVKS